MLQTQMLMQKAHTLALHYVSSQKVDRTPAEFLKCIQECERLFFEMLKEKH